MTRNEILSDTIAYLSARISDIAEDLYTISDMVEVDNDYHPRGTILKAQADQLRFKPKSMWVSLGDGKYLHLNGKKGLVTTHDRLDGYTDVVFSA